MFGNDDHNDAKTDAVLDSGQPAAASPSEVVHPDPLAVTAVAADDIGGSGISNTGAPASQPTTAPPAPPVPAGPEPGPSLSEVFSAGQTPASPAAPSPTHAPTLPPTPPPALPPTPAAHPSTDNDLIDLKRQALTQLSPLVDELDQPADEKFRTLMMMIQASDDQSMVRHAYDTALKIEDEKERAQALLDIVNEINYFTQSGIAPPAAAVDEAI